MHLVKRYGLGLCCDHSAHGSNDVVCAPPVLLFAHSGKQLLQDGWVVTAQKTERGKLNKLPI